MSMSRRRASAIAARVLVSDQAGKSNIIAELGRLGVNLEKDDQRLSRLLDEVKDKEAQGYAYEGADASFFLLAKRVMGETPHYFDVERYSVAVDRRFARNGGFGTQAPRPSSSCA